MARVSGRQTDDRSNFVNKKLFAEFVESMTQMNEIARGERAPARAFRDGTLLISAEPNATFITEATTGVAQDRKRTHANSVRQVPLTFGRVSCKKHS
jgi:hypothetical protein